MNALTLRQLRYFHSLARHGHFGHAAEACGVSQPALSVQIRELEQSLGAELVERTARRVRLTPVGEQVLSRVQGILTSVDELSDLARAGGEDLPTRLRLGIIPTIAPYLLPAICARLAQAAPTLDLHLRETLTPKLLAELENGRLDAAIVALPLGEAAFEEVELFEESFVLVRPLADAARPVPDAEGLRKMRLLLLEEGHCFRDQALAFCTPPAAIPREGLDGSSLTTLVQMVGAGLGVTLVPEMAIGVETRAVPVDVARFPEPAPSRRVGMIWRRSSPLARQLGEVARIVKGAAEG
ncbi:hydrogen peroxide-inducible genes activator [Roseobacter sp. HKCCA0434]|uniref:hydrogen peroxide-inducible genes activator n=1 Tax=Roseobacter sp. HKCCA0434 TaxID=3079297 RepID=UPI002905BB1E|nr:hydrogen peroxide-inducible genes activator [Roseobacter sp. HKCCA0434]